MERRAQAAMAAFEMLGTTADSTWINTVMRACYTDDVVRAFVMIPADFREHIFTGVSEIGETALRLGREAMREA